MLKNYTNPPYSPMHLMKHCKYLKKYILVLEIEKLEMKKLYFYFDGEFNGRV